MKKNKSRSKILFLQPIVSHYRKSVVENLIEQLHLVEFWGTSDYEGVLPMEFTSQVKNDLLIKTINIFGRKFYWYKNLHRKIKNYNPDIIVISGINPLLVNFILTFVYYRIFSNKKLFWWSQGKAFKQGLIGKLFRKYLYNLSDGILLYSEQGKLNFIKEGVCAKKLFVVNNCLNDEDYGYKQYPFPFNKDKFSILYSGRLSKRKKIYILLEAIDLLKRNYNISIPVHIIGDGEEKSELEEFVINKSLETVCFYGSLYGKETHQIFLNSSLFICPGAVGLSIVHAFSFGIPLLTGKNDPMHSSELELLEEGKTGDYFILDNSQSLAKKILEWKGKLSNGNNVEYVNNCINSIKEKGYEPVYVASNIIQGILE